MATNMTFIDFVTPVPADWLNNVNHFVNVTAASAVTYVSQLTHSPAEVNTAVAFTQNFSHKNLLDYGGVADGVTDNSAAIAAAIAACPVDAVSVYIPPGNWSFSTPLAHIFPANSVASFSLFGAGSDVTRLIFTLQNNPGIALQLSSSFHSYHIRDLSVLAGTHQGSQGLYVNQTLTPITNPANSSYSDVTNVTFRGSDGYIISDGWETDVYVYQASYINFIGCKFVGPYTSTGVNLEGTSPNIACVFNFIGCDFSGTNYGLEYGAYVQGVTVSNCNFDGCQYAVWIPPGIAGCDQLSINACQFGANAVCGVFMQSPCEATMIYGNFFIIADNAATHAAGITIQNSAGTSIYGNSFSPSAIPGTGNQNGIIIESYLSQCGVITGNVFQQINNAINLQTGSQHFNVQSNAYLSNTNNVINSGSNNTVGGGSA